MIWFRWMAAAATMLLVPLGEDLYLVLIGATVLLTADIKSPMTLKNYFLAYVALVFGLGGGILHLTSEPYLNEIFAYTAAFLVGYWLFGLSLNRPEFNPEPPQDRLKIPTIEGAISLVVCLSFLFLVYQISGYGLAGYYRGQALHDQFVNYGKGDTVGGIEQLIRFALTYSAAALVILYVWACKLAGTRILYRFPVVALVVTPALSLRRYDAIVGGLTLLAILSYERTIARAGTRELRRTSAAKRSGSGRPAPSERGHVRTGIRVAMAFAFLFALATALFVGNLRRSFTTNSSDISFTTMATSELTPVAAYTDIRSNIYQLGHPHGRTIVLPLVLKVVPRGWFPDKPLNSGAYAMSIVRTEEFAAGYALPPTYFGDVYLNFGFSGALLLCWALGAVCARLDAGYRRGSLTQMPAFLVVFSAFLPILRNPLSESLFQLIATLTLFAIAKRLWRQSDSPATEVGGSHSELVSPLTS